ncbi:c-type cytochrome [Roseovarius sp. SYSU LYC5161]|uniref:c-type cytochrome n=1 Tax=Roseovarius halophilus (ex Wu et al. 2025) TaxID=3376060 RepID=UPI0039994FA0
MKTFLTTAALLTLAAPAFAAGDADKGKKAFRQCKACHMIASADETIVRGGRVGPNLYGVIGRTAGSVEDYNYSDALASAGADGLVWDEQNLAEYSKDPSGFLGGRSKMTFKMRKGSEDVAAYLATFSD